MKINKEFSNLGLDFFAFSILVSTTFYFYERTFVLISKFEIVLQFFILFFFCLIFFYILKFILDYSNKLKWYFFSKFLTIIILSWVTVIFIKNIFFLTNYITLAQLIEKIFNLRIEFFSQNELFLRTFKFTLPYIISFIIITLSIKKIDKLKKIIISYSFATLLVIPLDIIQNFNSVKSQVINYDSKKVVKNSNLQKLKNKKNNPNRKVLLIIFDEADYQIINENLNSLNNISALSKRSFFPNNMYSPAINTINSVPSMLTNIPTAGNIFKKNKILILNNDKNLIEFNLKNSIFGKLSSSNYNYKILSSMLDYCTMLELDRNCDAKKFKELKSKNNIFKGVESTFTIIKKFRLFLKIHNNNNFLETNIKKIRNLKAPYKLVKDLDGHGLITFDKFSKLVNDKNIDFLFLHLSLPHMPSNYAQEIFNINTPKDIRAYTLNLKLLNIVIKKIFEIYEKSEFYENSLIILTGDHWARDKDIEQKTEYPVFFISKIFNDNNNILYNSNISLVNLPNFIINFFNGEINKNVDIKNFFQNNKFYETYLPKKLK